MEVSTVYISCYKYDYSSAKICLASIRYWYPHANIVLIKDKGKGDFDTSVAENTFGAKVFATEKKTYGWGYSKLEPLFLAEQSSFLIMDADTVMTGPVLDVVKGVNADFIVDDEVQPEKRFNEIYYRLDRINEIDPGFIYPGYSFNSGQWFGTSGILQRKDFETSLQWSDPPAPKYPDIIFNGDQAHLNFLLHKKEQSKQVTVARRKLMIWPEGTNAEFVDLNKIKNKSAEYPFIIHWAGMKADKHLGLPRQDIIDFYKEYYYTIAGNAQRQKDATKEKLIRFEKAASRFKFKVLNKLSGK